MPLLSNIAESVDADRIEPGHVCSYEVELLDENRDGVELLEVEVSKLRNAKVGVEYVQWQAYTGKSELVDLGYWNKENCSMEVNCTKNMRGNNVYYLSGV